MRSHTDRQLTDLVASAPVTVFDIGARGGAKTDLDAIKQAVDLVLFEPDKDALEGLSDPGGYRSWRKTDLALGAETATVQLNICSKAGCSSALRPLPEVAAPFGRADYYGIERQAQIKVRAMDDLVESGDLPAPHFLKVDVQGMEDQIFRGARRCLADHVIAIRTEVNFLRMYESLPLWGDIDAMLRGLGFAPMHWIEFHEWRRLTGKKPPKVDLGSVLPASRGQMVHADVLYLKTPEALRVGTDRNKGEKADAFLRLAAVAACFDQLDHAYAALSDPSAEQRLTELGLTAKEEILGPRSEALAKQWRRRAELEKWVGRLQRHIFGK